MRQALTALTALTTIGMASVTPAAAQASETPWKNVDIQWDGANESRAVDGPQTTNPGRRTPDLHSISVDADSAGRLYVSPYFGGDYEAADAVVVLDTTGDATADYLVVIRKHDHTSDVFRYRGSTAAAPRDGVGLGDALCSYYNPYGGGYGYFDRTCVGSPDTFTVLGAAAWLTDHAGTTWHDTLGPTPGTSFPAQTITGEYWAEPDDRPAKTAQARTTDTACPGGTVPPHSFSDVPDVYADAVSCLVWYGITNGAAPDRFDPHGTVTRGQMASFTERVLKATGMPVPAAVRDHTDGSRNVHAPAANRLIELGAFNPYRNDPARYVTIGDDTYPDLSTHVDRFFMADTMGRTMTVRSSQPLRPTGEYFDDDSNLDGHEFSEARHDALAEAGIAAGKDHRQFGPNDNLSRGQMALFLTRLLDHLFAEGLGSPKT